jgi:hypothetical protein
VFIWWFLIFHFILQKHLLNFRQNENMRKKLILAALFFISINTAIRAQVTIGSNVAPLPGSLLDVKETDANNENASKGIMLPRVHLSDLANLYPMFGSPGSPNSEYVANKSTLDAKYTGLIVYNVTESTPDNLKKGLYYWNGTKWIYSSDAWETSGNTGIDSTLNFIGTSDKQPLILKANNNEGLRIDTNGDVFIKHTPTFLSTQSQVLVKNQDGKIGVAGAVPTKLMLVQSSESQEYERNTGDSADSQGIIFNNGGISNTRSVLWKSNEIGMNNIVTEETHAAGGSFEHFIIKEKGLYEVSGFITYEPNCLYLTKSDRTLRDTINTISTAITGINVAIQKQTGTSAWYNIATTRAIWSGGAVSGTASMAAISPTTVSFAKGDKIRLVFYRPSNSFGRPHGKGNDKWGITHVYGIDIKKGLRVMMIGDDN